MHPLQPQGGVDDNKDSDCQLEQGHVFYKQSTQKANQQKKRRETAGTSGITPQKDCLNDYNVQKRTQSRGDVIAKSSRPNHRLPE